MFSIAGAISMSDPYRARSRRLQDTLYGCFEAHAIVFLEPCAFFSIAVRAPGSASSATLYPSTLHDCMVSTLWDCPNVRRL